MSAVLLGIVSSLGLQLSGSIARTARQQKTAATQQRWLALQLQRDAGLLIRQGALLAVDCSDSEQRRQGLEQLQSFLLRVGSIHPHEPFQIKRQLRLDGGLLQLSVNAGALQRQRDFRPVEGRRFRI